ncbi:unnamed protein product [Cuscuta campestris]|uniref:Uncharacterized protein n=1 Tax=Cuscuta campestris TaxID=132261 RepID=A0A484L5C9_9ASTE|nr:unnamed protein product [Cuscuta campestris]
MMAKVRITHENREAERRHLFFAMGAAKEIKRGALVFDSPHCGRNKNKRCSDAYNKPYERGCEKSQRCRHDGIGGLRSVGHGGHNEDHHEAGQGGHDEDHHEAGPGGHDAL